MVVLFFIFIVIPMLLFSAVSLALLTIFTRFITSVQEKRLGRVAQLSETEIREKAFAHVAWTYIGLLAAFLLFLVVYYFVT